MQINTSLSSSNADSDYGKTIPSKCVTFIDYLTLGINGIEDAATYFKWIEHQLKKFGVTVSKRFAKSPIGYDIAYQLCCIQNQNIVCGSIKYSACHKRVLLEITGNGCAMSAQNDNFSWLVALTQQPTVFIKRLDISYDDYEGAFSIQAVDKAYSRGCFNSFSNRRPQKKNCGNSIGGRTRYIGGMKAYKLLCVYEKGKKSKSNIYPHWVRHEIRFSANSRDHIPKEALTNLDSYFFSAFPKAYKRIISKVQYHPVVYRESLKYACDLGRSVGWLRHQYGRKIKEVNNILGSEKTIELISRDGRSQSYARLPFITDELLRLKFSSELSGNDPVEGTSTGDVE